jgi:hypothetical protein
MLEGRVEPKDDPSPGGSPDEIVFYRIPRAGEKRRRKKKKKDKPATRITIRY